MILKHATSDSLRLFKVLRQASLRYFSGMFKVIPESDEYDDDPVVIGRNNALSDFGDFTLSCVASADPRNKLCGIIVAPMIPIAETMKISHKVTN